MKINRSGSAVWSGGLKDGKGAISTQSGALDAHPYVSPRVSKGCRAAIPKN